ncbi:hypothetical protein CsSME_00038066 [Camellia sinensis var. sinensis]
MYSVYFEFDWSFVYSGHFFRLLLLSIVQRGKKKGADNREGGEKGCHRQLKKWVEQWSICVKLCKIGAAELKVCGRRGTTIVDSWERRGKIWAGQLGSRELLGENFVFLKVSHSCGFCLLGVRLPWLVQLEINFVDSLKIGEPLYGSLSQNYDEAL